MGNQQRPKVLIVGAGFAGLYCAKRLRKENIAITLVDRRNFHLFQPLLYQVASGSLASGDIAVPIRTEFVDYESVLVLQSHIKSLDIENKRVLTDTGQYLDYDYLVLATGSHHHYFGNDHWEDIAPGLKTLEDAFIIRRKILGAFERAERNINSPNINGLLTFVIVGGGPTGVELAGTIGELAHQTMKGEFRNINLSQTRVILVEGTDRILPPYLQESSAKAKTYLEKLGVEVIPNSFVTSIEDDHVMIKNKDGATQRIDTQTVLWAAGNKASALGKELAELTGAETDRMGRVIVDQYLNVPGHPEIFVTGDLAHVKKADGNPVPAVAPAAMQQGRYVASVLKAKINGKTPKPFKYFDKGSLAVVGRNKAIAEINGLRINGFLAWSFWAFIHVAYLIEFQNRAVVMFRWAINYLTRKRGARLITGEFPDENSPGNSRKEVIND